MRSPPAFKVPFVVYGGFMDDNKHANVPLRLKALSLFHPKDQHPHSSYLRAQTVSRRLHNSPLQ